MTRAENPTPLDKISLQIESDKELQERPEAANEFWERAIDVLYSFGNSEIRRSNDYSYRYLAPGVHKTPEFTFETESGSVTCYLEGEIVELKHSGPQGTAVREVSLVTVNEEEEQKTSVALNIEDRDLMPSIYPSAELRKALKVANRLHAEYMLGDFKETKAFNDIDIRHAL